MRKIRIGNDIRLKLKIEPNTEAGFDKIDEFDQSNVKQLRCYLINTSWFRPKKDEIHPKPFLRVGFPEFYHPTHHNINNAGFPSYHMLPANMCNYDRFSPDFHDFHWWPGYRGFGLHPEHFHDHCCHIQHGPRPKPSCCGFEPWWPFDYHFHPDHFGYWPHHDHFMHDHIHDPHCLNHPPLPPCAEPHHPEPEPYDIFGRTIEDHRHPDPYLPYYLADSQVLNEKNTLTCFFPAVQQKLCGTYKLVVILTVFEQGWGRHNLRTYTIDKGDVFELVDDETGESGNITIYPDTTGDREDLFSLIYTGTSNYTMASNTVMHVGEYDSLGTDYNIFVVLKDGTTVLYNPVDWHFTELKFESSDESVVKVGKDGTLYAQDIDGAEATATITVTDIDGKVAPAEYTVTVRYMDTIKIGFSSESEPENITSDDDFLGTYKIITGTYSVPNNKSGNYMWVFSQRKIHYIKGTEDDDEIVAELSSGFRIPMTNMTDDMIKDGYFCYRSAAPILSGDIKFKIKFA